jgi:hypothetical protein
MPDEPDPATWGQLHTSGNRRSSETTPAGGGMVLTSKTTSGNRALVSWRI